MITALILSIAVLGQPPEFERAVTDALARPVLAEGQTRAEWKRFVMTRMPRLEYPATAEAWTAKSEELRSNFLASVVYRGVPRNWYESPVRVEWVSDIETGKGYRIRKLRYEAVPGLWIPALLYEPVGQSGKMPAVLNVNGHVGPPGKSIEYEQVRCINLAKRGVLALHPEWLSFGELAGRGYSHGNLALLDLCGVSGLSVFYLAMERGLDVLWEYPSTDQSRVAMTGLSGGGWQTILLSALDTRISLTAPNAGYSGLASRTEYTQDIGDLEQVPSDLLTAGDYTHLTAMLAPRPALLIYNDKDDCCFESYRARPSVYDPIVPFYMLYGQEDAFKFHNNLEPGTHNYDLDNRQQFYRFLNRHWNLGATDTEIPYNGEILKYEELVVGLPESNATFVSLATDAMAALPRAGDQSATQLRETLRGVLRVPQVHSQTMEAGTEVLSDVQITRYRIRCGEWTVPGVAIAKSGTTPTELVVLVSDVSRKDMSSAAVDALNAGARVLAIDPVYLGESMLHPTSGWQYAMFFAATGERLLGQQVAQIAATTAWARAEFKPERVRLHAKGWNATVAVLTSVALQPDRNVAFMLDDAPDSLKQLIAESADFSKFPALYCFGLLATADISDLRRLAEANPGAIQPRAGVAP